jgi:hypothetical protein
LGGWGIRHLIPGRKVRVASYEEAAAVERADQLVAARADALPRLSYRMEL